MERLGNNIELIFDWAKLENFNESGIDDGLVLGETKLRIKGISKEKFRGYFDGTKWKPISEPIDFVNSWEQIANTEIDEVSNQIQLDGMYSTEKENFWIEWSFKYENCVIEWNSHVTFTERKE
ncbi:hypothetical protein BST86_12315 [Nonlabens agnitus]|uniref:Uncharacterized protein n=1 Tax=Nonlabens agnitus TaxID=870484 RepID=A0A2S9WWL0_9FLAO|nr:hypothetical protein BST86_12315 [Nonlabens agnitus]